jgi:hypothetical protein
MSSLGSLAGEAEREQRLLTRLNNAVITLEVDALGKAKDLQVTEQQVQQSRRELADFVDRLRAELDDRQASADLRSLAFRIRTGIKPLQDWQQDLADLSNQLTVPQPIRIEALPILEDVLSLLDTEFTDDLKRLYAR